MLLSTSYWPPVPACGFRDHGVYSFEPATAVAHDPAETGLRQVTAQPSGLTHIYHRQSLCADEAEQVLELLRGRTTQVRECFRTTFHRHLSLEIALCGSSRLLRGWMHIVHVRRL